MSKTILIVDDEAEIRRSLGGVLRDEGLRVAEARSGTQALEKVAESPPDVILLDIWMKGMDGLETLERLKADAPEVPVVMITGHGNVETAVKCLKLGAFDFIEKPLDIDKIMLTVQKALDRARLISENATLRASLEEHAATELVGDSPAIRKLREQIARAAPSDTWVLIGGESGAGKEVVARVLHKMSARASKPFVEVNCAAIPEELIESELFGYEKGAFTGASTTKRGKFDVANGGTLFLDEIADMSLRTQAKVLRILQEQSFERVGGTETHHVDVRVIAATNKDLRAEIEAGRFREDLYYRLNVIPLLVPPLRERPGDVRLLAEYFLERLCRETGRERKRIRPEAMAVLEGHSWPGNVRELKNAIERLVIMTPGTEIGLEDLPELTGRAARGSEEVDASFMAKARLKEARNDFERLFILRKLDENDWNISKTAEVIGLERSNLHRKIKAYGIEAPPSGKGR